MKNPIRAAVAATVLGVLAFAGHASAHTPSVVKSCSALTVTLTNYEGNAQNNVITTTIDGTSTVAHFAGSYSHTFAWSTTADHTYSVVIDANLHTGNATQFDATFQGSQTHCETPTTTTVVDKKVNICHRDQGHPEWKVIEISESALPAHLAHQWGADIYPVPEGGCPVPETTTTQPPETTVPPTTVPETTVPPVTTEPPQTTAPADTVAPIPTTVAPTPPTVATDIPPVAPTALPKTGRDNTATLLIAFGMAVIGAGCMWLARRKVNA